MTRRVLIFWSVVLSIGAAACGVHQAADPTLTGPSGFATNLTVTATPDSITQDGASRSIVVISARDASGQPFANLSVRVDMAVNGVANDFGTLSARNLVTGSNGQTTVTYTAPPAPPASLAGTINKVSIVATPVGTNAQVSSVPTFSADIRLVPVGVIMPPSGTPTASFTVSPTPVNQNVHVTFDGSASTPGTNASQISSYSWNFGDGDTANGVSVTHAYSTTGTFSATLTVTNDRGISASTTQQISVTASAAPSVGFVFSPSSPLVDQNVVFDASQSNGAPGHTVTQFNWVFGDGATGSGVQITHRFREVGTYAVTLTVVDETGQRSTASQSVSVGTANPIASFTSAAAVGTPPAHQMIFDGSGSAGVAGATITAYAWNFGDSSSAGSGAVVPHTYSGSGTFIVTLTVTDSQGATGVKSAAVVVP